MTRVSVVGLGAMGSRIAGRLVAAGHDVTVWNRTPARAEPLVGLGARTAHTPADAGAQAEVVITMVADPASLRSVTEGPRGILLGARPGSTVIEMSTVGPAAIARLAAALPREVGLLDAPVMGSIAEAESGSLVIFLGGPAALASRWSGLLSVLGSALHVGPVGAGARAKLVANAAHLSALAVLGEAVALADALGLPREVAFAVLATTPLGAQAARRRDAIERAHYPPRFALTLARKDADLISQAAATAGIDLRLAQGTRTWLADAEAAGLGDRDYTAVLAKILTTVSVGLPHSPMNARDPRPLAEKD
jgi:3-hydroxyisobutyrate dehydrogenase